MLPLIKIKRIHHGWDVNLLGIIDMGFVMVDKENEKSAAMLCFDIEFFSKVGLGITFSAR